MRINTNIAALNTYRQLTANNAKSSNSLEKLSSGLNINSAADDAAGLAISEKMRGQIRGLEQASRNAQDGISLIQTAEGALNETHSILQRMRELAVQAGNDTNTADDRAEIQEEINQLSSEINRIGNTTEFNTQKLLDGSIENGDAMVIDGTTTYSDTTLSNLLLDGSSSLSAGDYQATISNEAETIQNIADGQTDVDTNAEVDELTDGADIDLDEGSYQVEVTSENAKSTGDIGDDKDGQSTATVSVFDVEGGNNAITVDAGSTLGDADDYYVKVDKTVVQEIGTVDAGGISDLQLDGTAPATEGTYTVETAAGVTGSDNGGDIAGELMHDNIISNITIEDDSTYDNTSGYQIQVDQVDYSGTPAGHATYTFTLNSGEAEDTTNVDVTSTSGATQVKIGDVTFDVDLAALWASDSNDDGNPDSTYNSKMIDLTINSEVTVTQQSTGAEVTVSTANDAVDWTDKEFNFTTDGVNPGTGKLTLDLTQADFVAGNSYNTNVTWTDEYTVGLYNSGDTHQGTTDVTITEDQLSDPANLTNVQLGDAAHGVFADLSSTGLNSMTNGESVEMDFDIDEAVTLTAELQDMGGTAVGGSFALESAGGAGTETDIGQGVKLTYDTDNVAAGTIYFASKDVTEEDDFRISVDWDEDESGGGTYETNIVDKQAFNPNDTITIGDTGLSIDTTHDIAAGDNVTFTVAEGSADNSLTMQIGANMNQTFSVDVNDMRSVSLDISGTTSGGSHDTVTGASFGTDMDVTDGTNSTGTEYALDVSDAEKSTAAVEVLDNAINTVSSERSKLGAFQNRLEHTINNLGTSAENLTAAESRIRDVDMAKEMMDFTKNNILTQAAQAMLAQANQQPQGVLQLLR